MAEGALSDGERAAILRHGDACPACRALLADALRLLGGATSTVSPEGARAPAPPLSPGTTIDRYVVLDVLGAGGMGIVYAAKDPLLGRKVALKRVRAARAEGEGVRARLLREAQAMARLAHPNVVPVYDVVEVEGDVLVAMELVEGRTLREVLRDDAPSIDDVLRLFREAGEGLSAAHAAGLVHRDFKPDNVLVGNDGRVRITDFGLARGAEEAALSSRRAGARAGAANDRLTETGALVGTPAYMAPEQLAGGEADVRSDVFAFAVALYEALFGARPFEGADVSALRSAIERGEVRPGVAERRVPEAVRRALVGALAADPAARPGSVRALMEDVTRASREAAAPPAVSVATDAPPARGPAWRRLAVVPLVALVAAGAWALTSESPASKRAATASPDAHARLQVKSVHSAPAPTPVPVPVPTASASAPPPRVHLAPPSSPSSSARPLPAAPVSASAAPLTAPAWTIAHPFFCRVTLMSNANTFVLATSSPLAAMAFAPGANTTFEMLDEGYDYFSLQAPDGQLVYVSDDRTLAIGGTVRSPGGFFRVVARPNHTFALLAASGGFVTMDAKGVLRANAPAPDPSGDFTLTCMADPPKDAGAPLVVPPSPPPAITAAPAVALPAH